MKQGSKSSVFGLAIGLCIPYNLFHRYFEHMSKPEQQQITILLNGRLVQALPGQSVHAVLTAAGIRTLGTGPRQDRDRGVFCGMGVCYECLVTVNGRPCQRACMLEVEEGMEVEFHAL